jgi:hypothetical protein
LTAALIPSPQRSILDAHLHLIANVIRGEHLWDLLAAELDSTVVNSGQGYSHCEIIDSFSEMVTLVILSVSQSLDKTDSMKSDLFRMPVLCSISALFPVREVALRWR